MPNGPKIWDPLLAACAATYGSAVVAGGSVRDWSVNKNINPRDVDVFVPASDEMELELGFFKLRETLNHLMLVEPDRSGYGADEIAASNISCVAMGDTFDDMTKVNLIGKRFDPIDTQCLFADFDHSLCGFAYAGADVIASDDATKTLDTKQIIVYTPGTKTRTRLESLLRRNKSYGAFSVDWALFPKPKPLKFTSPGRSTITYGVEGLRFIDELLGRPLQQAAWVPAPAALPR